MSGGEEEEEDDDDGSVPTMLRNKERCWKPSPSKGGSWRLVGRSMERVKVAHLATLLTVMSVAASKGVCQTDRATTQIMKRK